MWAARSAGAFPDKQSAQDSLPPALDITIFARRENRAGSPPFRPSFAPLFAIAACFAAQAQSVPQAQLTQLAQSYGRTLDSAASPAPSKPKSCARGRELITPRIPMTVDAVPRIRAIPVQLTQSPIACCIVTHGRVNGIGGAATLRIELYVTGSPAPVPCPGRTVSTHLPIRRAPMLLRTMQSVVVPGERLNSTDGWRREGRRGGFRFATY
jgi:hypothetical protein